MANTKSAAKRAKQSERRRQHNVALRSRMRTAIKKVIKAIEGGDATIAATAFRAGAAEVSSMVNKGLTHRNKAARHQSRLSRAIKALTVKSSPDKSPTAKTPKAPKAAKTTKPAAKSTTKKKTVKKK